MRLFLLCSTIVFILACSKEPQNWETRCLSSAEYYCQPIYEDNYFHAIINGEELCFATGIDGYAQINGVYSSFITPADNPVFNQTNPSPVLGLGIWFILVKIENGFTSPYSWSIYLMAPPLPVDSFDQKKELDDLEFVSELPMRIGTDQNGYDFILSYSCNTDDVVGLGEPYLQSENVVLGHNRITQPADAYLRISSYSREDLGNAWQYDITFDMQLRLYYMDEVWKRFGDLEQGVFKTRTIVPK